jgi:hypothetical protein
MRWIRLWIEELLTGTTLRELDGEEFKVWILLMCYAARSKNNPGVVEKCDGIPYKMETLADLFNCEVEKLNKILRKLMEVNKIKILPDGRIKVINFEKYQTIYERYYKRKKVEKERVVDEVEREEVAEGVAEEEQKEPTIEELQKKLDYLNNYIIDLQKKLPLYKEQADKHPDSENAKKVLKMALDNYRDAIDRKREIEELLDKKLKKGE